MSFQSILSTEIDLLDDSDAEKESKRDLLLVCVLAGEYLSAKMERPTFYVRERFEWEKHIQQLAVEWSEAFLKMYRMEYSSFMKLSNCFVASILFCFTSWLLTPYNVCSKISF